MIEAIHLDGDKEKYVIAYCEYSLRNEFGKEDSKGEYCFVDNIWIHPDYRYKGFMGWFLKIIEPKVPTAAYVYWEREKYDKRVSKTFSRRKIHERLRIKE